MENTTPRIDQYFERAQTQLRRGTLEIAVLAAIQKDGEAYTSDIIGSLNAVDQLVVEGTLYPLLARLRTEGFIDYRWEESNAGPPRKYYRLTSAGTEALTQLLTTLKNLTDSLNRLT